MSIFDPEYRAKHVEKKPWLSWLPLGFPTYYKYLVADGRYKRPSFSFKIPSELGVDAYFKDSQSWATKAQAAIANGEVLSEHLEYILESAFYIIKQKQRDQPSVPVPTMEDLLDQLFEEQGEKVADMLIRGVRYGNIAKALDISIGTVRQLVESDRIKKLLEEKKKEIHLLASLLEHSNHYNVLTSLQKIFDSALPESMEYINAVKVLAAWAKPQGVNVTASSKGTQTHATAENAETPMSIDKVIDKLFSTVISGEDETE